MGTTDDPWIPLTKGTWRGKCFPVLTPFMYGDQFNIFIVANFVLRKYISLNKCHISLRSGSNVTTADVDKPVYLKFGYTAGVCNPVNHTSDLISALFPSKSYKWGDDWVWFGWRRRLSRKTGFTTCRFRIRIPFILYIYIYIGISTGLYKIDMVIFYIAMGLSNEYTAEKLDTIIVKNA